MRGRWTTTIGASGGDDDNVVALRAKVRALVASKYGGSFRALFDHYGQGDARGADRAALTQLLADADVGNMLTRGLWADGVMARVDVNRDGFISWDEFAQIVGLPEALGTPAPMPTQAPPGGTPAPMPTHDAPSGTPAPMPFDRGYLVLGAGLVGTGVVFALLRAAGER